MTYWEETFLEAIEAANLPLPTGDYLKRAVEIIEWAHENYGMMHGYDAIPNPLRLENEQLKKALDKERNKKDCEICGGRGRIISHGPSHSSNSQCYKCSGEGRI